MTLMSRARSTPPPCRRAGRGRRCSPAPRSRGDRGPPDQTRTVMSISTAIGCHPQRFRRIIVHLRKYKGERSEAEDRKYGTALVYSTMVRSHWRFRNRAPNMLANLV